MAIQSLPSSLTAHPHQEEYRIADIAFYPAEDNHMLIHAKNADATSILHTAYVDLLTHCCEFRTLDEHISTFCQDRQVSERITQGLRSKLQHLANEGYLISRNQFHLEESNEQLPSRQSGYQASGIMYRLPNGLPVALQASDPFIEHTLFIYNEIFQQEIYLRHGIELAKGDCVIDVGANIGLFSLFVHEKCGNAMIYAFEPIPPTFELLRTNIHLHGQKAKLCNYGLGASAETTTFTYYPILHGWSISSAHEETCKALINQAINQHVKHEIRSNPSIKDDPGLMQQIQADYENYFRSETYECPVRTLSDVIRENSIERIDLLKVDVERSEIDVLTGIEAADWSKIKQVVMEAHSSELAETATRMMRQHGFECFSDSYASSNWMVYGIRAN